MKEKEGEEELLKRATIDLKFIKENAVVDFTTKNSRRLFKKLEFPKDFPKYPAAQKKHQPGFNAAKSFISTIGCY